MSEESLLTESVVPSDTGVSESSTDAIGTVSDEPTEAGTTETPPWFLSEDVSGQGDAPEWFKAGKYKTVADQAKAYAGLESKLGSFTGAPEDGYTVELPEGIEIPGDDPLMTQFNDWANEAGLSQEAHTKLLGIYMENMVGSQPNMEAEMTKIGKDAPQRINDLVSWARANLSEGEFEVMQGMTTTSEGFGLLEKMRSMTRQSQVSAPDNALPVEGMTESKLYEMVGDPRYSESASYRAEVDKKFADFFGSQPASETRQ